MAVISTGTCRQSPHHHANPFPTSAPCPGVFIPSPPFPIIPPRDHVAPPHFQPQPSSQSRPVPSPELPSVPPPGPLLIPSRPAPATPSLQCVVPPYLFSSPPSSRPPPPPWPPRHSSPPAPRPSPSPSAPRTSTSGCKPATTPKTTAPPSRGHGLGSGRTCPPFPQNHPP